MSRALWSVVVLVFVLLDRQPVAAQTIRYVDNVRACDGREPCYRTIMAAVDAALPLDTIEVFPGVYREAVVIEGKGPLVLKAHDEGLTPVIAAPGRANAVGIASSTDVQVHGFIFEAAHGAGVAVTDASGVVVEDNLITALRGLTLQASVSCDISSNTLVGGGIAIGSGRDCVIETNVIHGVGIAIGGDSSGVKQTELRGNLITAGGIALVGKNLKGNTIDANFVSGNIGDGIRLLVTNGGPGNVITGNTSIGNTGCDIADLGSRTTQNTWSNNRFATRCGAAGD